MVRNAWLQSSYPPQRQPVGDTCTHLQDRRVRCMPLLRRSRFKRRRVAHKHDLAYHASLPEQLLRVSCLSKRKSLRNLSVWML